MEVCAPAAVFLGAEYQIPPVPSGIADHGFVGPDHQRQYSLIAFSSEQAKAMG